MKTRKTLLAGLVCLSAASLASCVNPTPSTSSSSSTSSQAGVQWTNEDFEDLEAAVSVATGGSLENYVGESYEERAKILGLLEEYAMRNGITGIVLYDDGGYTKVSDKLEIPTKVKLDSQGNEVKIGNTKQHEYIVSYGFGILSEGKKNATATEADPYAAYYKTYETADPQTLNYMNDKGSVVGGLQGYVSSGYFGTRLTSSKDSYEWYPSLATDANVVNGQFRPIPLNMEEGAQSCTKYRIYVRDDVKYATEGQYKDTYNGRVVALEDYVTPWKELHNQKNAMARATDNFNTASEIVGLADYHAATAAGHSDEAWDKVGIKTGTDATNGNYLEFEFVTPCTPFYAMYYLNSSLYTPIPKDFLDSIGGIGVWSSFNTDKTLSPVDTTLSTGPYVVKEWKSNEEIIFSKNTVTSAEVQGGEHRYQIEGVHVDIFEAAVKDPMAAWNEFKKGNFDSVGIPTDLVATEVGTDGTQQTKGNSTTKLNVNTCTQEEWEYLFGENGIVQPTPVSDYWEVEPAMSNEDFILGLNLAIDREEYATKRGITPSCNYFSDAYLSDPESGISYNSTQAHKDALYAIYGEDVDTYGFNYSKAVAAFKRAGEKLIADGAYKAGDTIQIEIAWQADTQINTSGKDIEAYLEDAFNAAETGLTLEVVHWAPALWSDVYYKKMMVGQFDIGFGGIEGNPWNPLNFMEVLKSDNSSGFTLNWGPNTNDPEALIDYDGKKWTFDALWKAADTGAFVASNGALGNTHDAVLVSSKKNADDNGRTIVLKTGATNIEGVLSTEMEAIVLCWYDATNEDGYDEIELVAGTDYTVAADGTVTITLSAEQVELYQGQVGIDIYWTSPQLGNAYDSLYLAFPTVVE